MILKQSTTLLCSVSKVRVVRESDHRLVRHEHGEGFRSETVLEVHGEHLLVVSVYSVLQS